MFNSPYFEKMENYVSQVGRLFCAQEAAVTTNIPTRKAFELVKFMADEGMLVRLKKASRIQYYRYDETFDYATWIAKQKRLEGRKFMRENSTQFYQILSEVGYA